MSAVTGISGIQLSAASAAFAPTNSADVSAIASAYQVVSATATQLNAGTAYLTSVNETPISASRAGNAANASLATSAWYDGTGRLISALPDEAAVSSIASAYAESAVSSKADSSALSSYVPYSSLEYNTASAISGINGSALAAGSTYSAGEGIDITNDVISVEAPVDIVAGPGIVIDNPDGNTLRVSVAQDYNKVLWSGIAATSANVSESIFNFERCRMVIQENDATNTVAECEFEIVPGTTTYDVIALYYGGSSNPFQMETAPVTITNDGTTVSIGTVIRRYFPASTGAGGSDSNTGKMTKVVGIHRIANN